MTRSLLSLVLLSCIVAPIRDIGNKFFSTSATMNSASKITLLTGIGINIDNFISNIADNYNEVRGCTLASNKQASKTVLMFSSKASVNYATRMEHLNDCPENKDSREPINSSQLLYMIPREHGNQVSIAADPNSNIRQQCVPIKGLALNNFCNSNKNMFNMYLPYNIN